MPVIKCSNGKYRIGGGECIYSSEVQAEKAYAAYRAKKHDNPGHGFTDESWQGIKADLTADEYCECCLIDMNPENADKKKGLCKIVVRSAPNAPYNKNQIRSRMARIFQLKDVPADKKSEAARKIIELAKRAGMAVTSESLLRLAGMKVKK